jgi:hypothetical protein
VIFAVDIGLQGCKRFGPGLKATHQVAKQGIFYFPKSPVRAAAFSASSGTVIRSKKLCKHKVV